MKVYERKSFPRMARDLKSMYEKGNLSFDNAVQRSFVWKNTEKDNRMSMLIDSMIRGLPIPSMYCNCIFEDVKSKIYDFIDGKQRTLTICKFLNNEFALVNIPSFQFEDGEEMDLNGKTYSQLPEDVQDIIKTYSITVYYYENMEQEDAEEMFRRLNNGKSLSAIELTRANAISKEQIKELSKHELFNVALSEKSLSGYVNEDIVIKTWIVLFGNKKSFETKEIRPIIRETVITEAQKNEIRNCFNIALNIYGKLKEDDQTKIIRKLFTKTHLISLMSIFKIVVDKKIDARVIEDWMIRFFGTGKRETSISNVYNENSRAGSAKEDAVRIRMRILVDDFEKFLSEK